MHEPSDVPVPKQAVDREALLERRLARSEAARAEAEQLLETKSRHLAETEVVLLQKEEQLLERVNRQTLSLISAQKLADVATFHGDEDKRFIGSNNFADVIGSKTPVTSFEQFAKMVHPQDHEEAMAVLSAADRWELVDKNVERDFRFCDDYGKVRWLRWSVTQSQSADGQRFFGYGAVRNITKERKAERQEHVMLKLSQRRAEQLQNLSIDLKKAREEEEQKSLLLGQRLADMEIMGVALESARAEAVAANQSKSRFLAMMSHDIRTPMNAILATLELLSISDLTPDQFKKVELARNSSDQLLFLLADIIEYARTDGWKFALKMQELELPSLIEKAVDTWQPLASKKKLDISVKYSPDCPEFILSDPTRIRQIIDNFISNSIKYTNDGQIIVEAETLSRDDRNFLKLSIIDSGPGIEPDIQNRLFEDFHRGDAAESEIEGTGLGLSICRRIVKAMDGDIGVDSEIGQGSSFWFIVPVITSDGSQLASIKMPSVAPNRIEIAGRAPKILVAEDVEANQIVIVAMLETMGCEAVVVDDGSKVLDALNQQPFDGILMDVWMPTNGTDATRQVRASKQHANIPIYGVTAFAADDERSAILASGMDGVISKPINLAGLHYAIGQICGLAGEISPSNPDNPKSVPNFGRVEFVDIEKLREQLFSVPESRRKLLIDAVCDDLRNWHKKFEQAWLEQDEAGVKSAHHALRGVCNGFGAFSLLEKIDSVHQKGKIGQEEDILPICDLLDFTVDAINRFDPGSD